MIVVFSVVTADNYEITMYALNLFIWLYCALIFFTVGHTWFFEPLTTLVA